MNANKSSYYIGYERVDKEAWEEKKGKSEMAFGTKILDSINRSMRMVRRESSK